MLRTKNISPLRQKAHHQTQRSDRPLGSRDENVLGYSGTVGT